MAKTATPSTSAATAAAPRRSPRTLAGTVSSADSAARNRTLAHYETAVKLLHAGKYDKAHAAFNEMLTTAPHDLADRIRMYIATCVSHVDQGTTSFESHEERYDYAISLLNHGHYEDARQHFDEILLSNGSADYAFYGLALLASMTNHAEDCIEHLREAIRLNPQNRFQARGDADFDAVADDPRFTELLYPDA